MELDNFKNTWKEMAPGEMKTSKEELLVMLQQKSQRPIARMKRNLYWEAGAVIVLYSFAALLNYFVNPMFFAEMATILLVVGVLGLYYYYRKLNLLKEMECVQCEVRSNLNRQITMLEKYIRFYFLAGTVLAPLVYFVSGFIIINKLPVYPTRGASFYILFAGFGIILTGVSYFLNKWYVDRLYGQHVAQLKNLLSQFEEE
jgi:hypothetical protein